MRVHLSRWWRPKTFSEVVGQSLSIRLLKNILYRGAFFPTYLFSGMRGTGKTTVGRLFAAAINCRQLDQFVLQPRDTVLPCTRCDNCEAILQQRHPDVYEIDAASHTGVDTIRSIIEHAVLSPVLGRKKIYLIDEAHMLSKAAFNACLKIFEEPPEHVIFILATTDAHKIIETVSSRCFQLFFDPFTQDQVSDHLLHVARDEGLVLSKEAADAIALFSQGSLRDALTLLERASLLHPVLSPAHIYELVGVLSQDEIALAVSHAQQGDAIALDSLLSSRSWYEGRQMHALFKSMLQEKWYAGLQNSSLKQDNESIREILERLYDRASFWTGRLTAHELVYLLLDSMLSQQGMVKKSITESVPGPVQVTSKAIEPSRMYREGIDRIIALQPEPFVVAALQGAIHRYDAETKNYTLEVAPRHTFIREWIEKALVRMKQPAEDLGIKLTILFAPSGSIQPDVESPVKHLQSTNKAVATSLAREAVVAVPPIVTEALKHFPGARVTVEKNNQNDKSD